MRIDPAARRIAMAVAEVGGRAYIIGGAVRDRLLGTDCQSKDLDLEVFDVPVPRLRALLCHLGPVDEVGASFAVFKVGGMDVSVPRRERTTGPGHWDFEVTGDPHMSLEEAARRRDFTINAIFLDPLTGQISDPINGIRDLHARTLRAVDPVRFVEDPLRVLRAMQFAARFEFQIEPSTIALAKSIDLSYLPAERIGGEIEKLLLLSRRPSHGFTYGGAMGVIGQLFPELLALVACEQDPQWHPEGSVWTHTMQVIDLAAALSTDLPRPKRLAVMLAALCHDLGKPSTTTFEGGHVRALGHSEAGIEPTRSFLRRLRVESLDGYDVRAQVLALVRDHLTPGMFYRRRDEIGNSAFRRLANRCELDLLYRVAKADALGRRTPEYDPPCDAEEWFIEQARSLNIEHRGPAPILMGRHLLGLGMQPGPLIGKMCRFVYDQQLEGSITTLDEAIEFVRAIQRIHPLD